MGRIKLIVAFVLIGVTQQPLYADSGTTELYDLDLHVRKNVRIQFNVNTIEWPNSVVDHSQATADDIEAGVFPSFPF